MVQRRTVGVLLPLVGGYYYAGILAGIQRVADRSGARVVAFQTTGMDLLWPNEPSTMPLGWKAVDAWISVVEQPTAFLECLGRSQKPYVTISARNGSGEVPAVLPDNFGGTYQAVAHLIEHGHRRIAFVGNMLQEDIRERCEAWRTALSDHGIACDAELLFDTHCNLELEARTVGQRWAAQGLPCTAVVTGTDLNAIGLMHALQAAGHRIPEDIAVIGFDDIEPAQYFDPPLATVRQDFQRVGEAAAELLFRRMENAAGVPSETRVPTQFVPRFSCGCHGRMSVYPGSGTTSDSVVDRLAAELLACSAEARAPELDTQAERGGAARDLATHIHQLADGDPGLPSHAVRSGWARLLRGGHDVGTVDRLLTIVERVLGARGRPDERTHRALRETRVELFRAWRIVQHAWRQYYDAASEANRKVTLSLIGTDLENAQNLNWLGLTNARQACLAMWDVGQVQFGRELHVVSVFGEVPHTSELIGARYAPEAFPPPALCKRLDQLGQEAVLSVIPITGPAGNRGLLCVIRRIEVDMFDDTGSLGQWASLLSAAIDREELVRSLRESGERYELAARGANDGLWDWDLATGEVYYSPRWLAMIGQAEHDVGTTIEAWFARVHPDDVTALKCSIQEHCLGKRPHIEQEYRLLHRDGSYRWMLCRGVAVFGADGRAVRLAGSQTEITMRKQAEERLRQSALHDALTGLPNRALLMDRLEQAIARAQRAPDYRFAVLFLDLDRFKTINDSLGHLAGDQLLIEVSRRLRRCLRSCDTVARLGGDEFAIIIELSHDGDATAVADRIHRDLGATYNLDGHQVVTSTSIGITLSSPQYKRPEDFLRDADTAMYRAKTQGRARHELFDVRMHNQAMARLRMEADLRRALQHEELVLHYQPVLSLRDDEIVGVEALIRWQHPEQGLLSPAAFLATAEESGLIVPISHWVLRAACREMKRWGGELDGIMRATVNIPSQQLKEPGFIELVVNTLEQCGLTAAALGIELVESTLIEDRETTIHVLERLQAMGVYIAVDDFGTGYSSLSYLKRFPLSALKIDRSFIQGVPEDPNDTAISSAIIAMAKNLNLSVVAEGVETQEQAQFLRRYGCDAMQGYLFSRALPAEACLKLIKQHRAKKLVSVA